MIYAKRRTFAERCHVCLKGITPPPSPTARGPPWISEGCGPPSSRAAPGRAWERRRRYSLPPTGLPGAPGDRPATSNVEPTRPRGVGEQRSRALAGTARHRRRPRRASVEPRTNRRARRTAALYADRRMPDASPGSSHPSSENRRRRLHPSRWTLRAPAVAGAGHPNGLARVLEPLYCSSRRPLVRVAALARYGLNVTDVQETVAASGSGELVSEVIEGQKRYTVALRLPDRYRTDPDAVRAILLRAPGGEHVALDEVARVAVTRGPEKIEREEGQRRIVVMSNVRGRGRSTAISPGSTMTPCGPPRDW